MLWHGNLMGPHLKGGALALVGDDLAAKSSTLPCAPHGALADLNMPYLFPADSQDVLDLAAMRSSCPGHGAMGGTEDRHRGRRRIVHGQPGRRLACPAASAGRRDACADGAAAGPTLGQLERGMETGSASPGSPRA